MIAVVPVSQGQGPLKLCLFPISSETVRAAASHVPARYHSSHRRESLPYRESEMNLAPPSHIPISPSHVPSRLLPQFRYRHHKRARRGRGQEASFREPSKSASISRAFLPGKFPNMCSLGRQTAAFLLRHRFIYGSTTTRLPKLSTFTYT